MMRRAWIVWTVLGFAAGLWVGIGLAQPKPRMWADVLLQVTTGDIPRDRKSVV